MAAYMNSGSGPRKRPSQNIDLSQIGGDHESVFHHTLESFETNSSPLVDEDELEQNRRTYFENNRKRDRNKKDFSF